MEIFSSARGSVVRSTLLFSPFFALALLAFIYILLDSVSDGFGPGRIFGLIIVGFMTLLLGYQVVQSLRDLFSSTVETTGEIERKWSRNEFMLFRNSYVFVQGNVFRLEAKHALEVEIGDTVRIVHFPHTTAVESIELVGRRKQS